MTAQLLDITADAYHADPCETPSLNATVATAFVLQTPSHAKQLHPRLADGGYVPHYSDAMDDGTALHQMLLGDDRCDILPFDEYRSNEAKSARDASRAAGRTPIKRKRWNELSALGESLKQQVAAFPADPPLFVDGMAEQTIIGDEGDWCWRVRLDWLHNDFTVIDDLKKARSAEPYKFRRSLWQLGYPYKAAFYVRACKAAFGVEPRFRWAAIEADPPYAMSVHELSAPALAAAQDRLDEAISDWKACLASGDWPAYPRMVHTVDLPEWMAPAEWDDASLTSVPF